MAARLAQWDSEYLEARERKAGARVRLLKLQNAHILVPPHLRHATLSHMRHGDRARVHTVIRAGPGALVTTQLASRYLVR